MEMYLTFQKEKMCMINLMYHCVYCGSATESGFQGVGPNLYKVGVERFERHIQDAVGYCQKYSDAKITFTFDDGGVSFYSVIAPLLERSGIKGIFFITTSRIGTPGFLTPEQIVDLDRRGHIIGSHSHSHKEMSELSLEEIDFEWGRSLEILSEILHRPIIYASVPNGFESSTVMASAANHGIKFLYTSVPTTKIRYYGETAIMGRYVILHNSPKDYISACLAVRTYRAYLDIRFRMLHCLKKILGKAYYPFRNFIYRSVK